MHSTSSGSLTLKHWPHTCMGDCRVVERVNPSLRQVPDLKQSLNRLYLEAFGASGVLMRWEGVEARLEQLRTLVSFVSEFVSKQNGFMKTLVEATGWNDMRTLAHFLLRNFPHRILRAQGGHERVPASDATYVVAKGGTLVSIVRDSALKVHGRALGRAADVVVIAFSLHLHQMKEEAKASFVVAFPRSVLGDQIPRELQGPPPGDPDTHWMEDLSGVPGVKMVFRVQRRVPSGKESDASTLHALRRMLSEYGSCRMGETPECDAQGPFLTVPAPSVRAMASWRVPPKWHHREVLNASVDGKAPPTMVLGAFLSRNCHNNQGIILCSVKYPSFSLTRDHEMFGVGKMLSTACNHEAEDSKDPKSFWVSSCALTAAIDCRLLRKIRPAKSFSSPSFDLPDEEGRSASLLLAELREEAASRTRKEIESALAKCSTSGTCPEFDDGGRLRFLSRLGQGRIEDVLQQAFERQARRETVLPSFVRTRVNDPTEHQVGRAGGWSWGSSLKGLGLSLDYRQAGSSKVFVLRNPGRGKGDLPVDMQVEVYVYSSLLPAETEALSKVYMAGEVNNENGRVFVDRETQSLVITRLLAVNGGREESELWDESVEGLRKVLREGCSGVVRRQSDGYACLGTEKCKAIQRFYLHPLETCIFKQQSRECQRLGDPPCWICGGQL
uniref:Uncharacterized protein n=1 Tax=Chromera velia CCMP2878 TaxID=1169474 RepID=A0A0G4IEG1_9ALVE|eukprot:Cvel_13717.t1-p1 / transcript=Cvel_13717.t1 / gene=Cvel_13717 / organism=Chromera_velia_CCMP2878 / gene_product=hypothetical protein / transcript_product=hypothetical protein / location=Cvel_scaffold948:27544-31087(+) / protein_length=669 / sequence_SO=supercontig / SO=protein_coding / is_pseudo=false